MIWIIAHLNEQVSNILKKLIVSFSNIFVTKRYCRSHKVKRCYMLPPLKNNNFPFSLLIRLNPIIECKTREVLQKDLSWHLSISNFFLYLQLQLISGCEYVPFKLTFSVTKLTINHLLSHLPKATICIYLIVIKS